MSLVNWLPNVSTQSRVFISGNEIQGMVTYIPVGGGAGEMAIIIIIIIIIPPNFSTLLVLDTGHLRIPVMREDTRRCI